MNMFVHNHWRQSIFVYTWIYDTVKMISDIWKNDILCWLKRDRLWSVTSKYPRTITPMLHLSYRHTLQSTVEGYLVRLTSIGYRWRNAIFCNIRWNVKQGKSCGLIWPCRYQYLIYLALSAQKRFHAERCNTGLGEHMRTTYDRSQNEYIFLIKVNWGPCLAIDVRRRGFSSKELICYKWTKPNYPALQRNYWKVSNLEISIWRPKRKILLIRGHPCTLAGWDARKYSAP